jgi:hypothetical protein
MSNRKFFRIIQGSLSKIGKSFRAIPQSFVNWLLRIALAVTRRTQSAGGFVLPTVVLLILVVSLTVGALTYRAFTRNTQVIAANQQRVIYNAATPTIDRARSKLEYLFDPAKDNRYPGGVPSETFLQGMLLNYSGNAFGVAPLPTSTANVSGNAYDLPDETRLDIGGDPATGGADGRLDNAWSYRTDTDGDGNTDATVIYSVIMLAPTPITGATPVTSKTSQRRLLELSGNDAEKAKNLWIRHGPLSNELKGLGCSTTTQSKTEAGWFEDSSQPSKLRKNFQVDAFVVPDSPKSSATTLEFHQDREVDKGNKWAAWFRNDLEVHPGPGMEWNGAMHTEGSLILGSQAQTTIYLVSGENSCLLNDETASYIDVASVAADKNPSGNDFIGHILAGVVGGDNKTGTAVIHGQNGLKAVTSSGNLQSSGNNSSTDVIPSQVLIDPEEIVLNDGYKSRGTDVTNGSISKWGTATTNFPAILNTTAFGNVTTSRIRQPKSQKAPSIDDLYRADDRWGPKPNYGGRATVPATTRIGTAIPAGNNNLTGSDVPVGGDAANVGLDGYWERRARWEGLRLLVGQRLELGNLNGWITARDNNSNNYIDLAAGSTINPADDREGDPLYPPTVKPYPVANSGTSLTHVGLQRRTLRDNLAAVQSAAVYHSAATNKDFPIACLASTSHPGTVTTLRQSINFFPTIFKNGTGAADAFLLTNFFTGQGTNGWEFAPPATDEGTFQTALGGPLGIALNNLANFAGDPQGAFPPVQEAAGGNIHPYPALSMWGNYSELKRALSQPYANLSVADKTYLHTAACTLGMLAYNIDQVQKFDPTNIQNDVLVSTVSRVMSELGFALAGYMDGISDPTGTSPGPAINYEVLPRSQLATYGYNQAGTYNGALYNPRDYDNVPAEAFIGALRQETVASGGNLNDPKLRMAELIMLHYQIRRDRTFGFRSSPAYGEYSAKFGTAPAGVFPTACDPDQFAMQATIPTRTAANNGALFRHRLGLSRLCGTIQVPTGYAPVALRPPGDPSRTDPRDARPVVLPKFPALYYIFPETAHGLRGNFTDTAPLNGVANTGTEYDHRQPGELTLATAATAPAAPEFNPNDKEPYVVDDYINALPAITFTPVSTSLAPETHLADTLPYLASTAENTSVPATVGGVDPANPAPTITTRNALVNYPYTTRRPFPIADRLVDVVAIQPRTVNGFPSGASLTAGILPTANPTTPVTSTAITGGPNIPTNIIVAPNDVTNRLATANTTFVAVPFLERAFFDGRQLMSIRAMDVDLGMLRSKAYTAREPWLPLSGIVYAFREDAVREDGIARPQGALMNLTSPASPIDPGTTSARGISIKAVDFLPDPDRRPYGFRLRNGSQLKRNTGLSSAPAEDNFRGLSFLTDQPVYIQGDFNLHQDGIDDTAGAIQEEFDVNLLPDYKNFYDRIGDNTDKFANPTVDRWRPSEILADSITILSVNFCDGSIADTFVLPSAVTQRPDFNLMPNSGSPSIGNPTISRSMYGDVLGGTGLTNSKGLFGEGCLATTNGGYTSYLNQNRPQSILPDRWDWVRETASDVTLPQRSTNPNPATYYWPDFTSPIKIDRTGDPLVASPKTTILAGPLPRPVAYDAGGGRTYFPTNAQRNGSNTGGDGRLVMVAPTKPPAGQTSKDVRVNGILVSGISPSRKNQGYGGLHNFPRFLEDWGRNPAEKPLYIAGSFLQLSFSNYGTAPFEQEAWEPAGYNKAESAETREHLAYYTEPRRFWGYDTGLQFAAASPAATRFVTPSTNRNEFYSEPPANDPYINRLCTALKTAPNVPATTKANLNCAA